MSILGRAALVFVWIGATAMAAVLVFLAYVMMPGARTAPEPMPIEQMPPRQSHHRWARWTVTEHVSAHNVLIVHVETRFLPEALSISYQLVESIQGQYAEVLIYFHRPGRPDTLPPRRVQWTPTTGFVETVYE
jgi:hypothetical protein